MIKPFDSGWSYILNLFSKLISLLVIWSCNCSNITKKKVTHLGSSIVQVFWSTLNIIPQWILKPRIKKSFKHRKASNGVGRFAINLHKCKYSHYDAQNCKSGQHNWHHFSNNTDYGTNPTRPTLHMTDWQSKKEMDIHSLSLVDKLGCSALTLVVKMILFADLQDSSRLYYIPTNLIWTTTICQSIQHILCCILKSKLTSVLMRRV